MVVPGGWYLAVGSRNWFLSPALQSGLVLAVLGFGVLLSDLLDRALKRRRT